MGLGLYQILVGRLEKQPEGWVCQIWDVLSWRIQTNKQLEQLKKKDFINLQFLQKLSRHKPFWDKDRLSSLVNKRSVPVGLYLLLE